MEMPNLRQFFIGKPLATSEAQHERLSKIKALAVFASDALSSTAYATEEILRVLAFVGAGYLYLATPIASAIAILLVIVGISYYQTIHAYPNGGGSYIVSKDNLGIWPGLIAGAALLVDYVLTVAVSIAAGVAALFSWVPELLPFRVEIAVGLVIIMTIINLRGVRESGTIFAVPTYVFIVSVVALLGAGLYQFATNTLQTVDLSLVHTELLASEEFGLFLVLRAFAAGCTALTGVEAISNGIPAFKRPESDNAGKTLIAMVLILGVMFIGITILAHQIEALPLEHETIMSQVARTVFGNNGLYALMQLATALILVMAANTSFADFPRLSSLIARDGFLPRQLSNIGDRLVFSNGIVLLGVLASILLVAFDGDTHALLPLYAIGVFLSFTLSQSGMVVHWFKLKTHNWQREAVINGLGAFATFVVLMVIVVTRFTHGGWIVVVLIPIIVAMFLLISHHYQQTAVQLSLDDYSAPPPIRRHRVVVLIAGVHRGVLDALVYARSLSHDVTAVYIETDPAETEKVRAKWNQWGDGVRLVVLRSDYRSLVEPLITYLDKLDACQQDDMITIVMPQFLASRWWHNLLHNQTALLVRMALVFRRGFVVTDVPYRLKD